VRARLARWGVALAALAIVGGCGDDGPAVDSAAPAGTSATAVAPVGAVTVDGPPAPPTPVGPSAGSPLAGIDRDAGISVKLSDGSVMWLFGDTAIKELNGRLRFFVIGTAAWAPADQPTVTRDFVGPSGQPTAFATPTADFPACPPGAPVAGMWPASAVAHRVGDRDRIVVWLENICLGDGTRGFGVGTSVAEVWYDPAHPPDGEQITAKILNQRLFPRRGFGLAATLGDHDDAYVYTCDARLDAKFPTEFGPCQVAVVDLDQVADPSKYRVWSGGDSWVPITNARATELAMPSSDPVHQYPIGSVSVSRDPASGRYVMVYSPWPGVSNEMAVRFSARPEGPWTEPSVVKLDGCHDTVAGASYYCYAASSQPSFSEPGRLGLGYYDRSIATGLLRGSYMVTTVPITVTP